MRASYLVNSAVTLGAAELLVVAALTGEPLAVAALRPVVGLLVVLNLALLVLLVGDLYPLLSRLYARREFGVAGLFVLLTGVVIPAASLLAGGVPATASVAMASLVLASLGVRYAIVRLPHDATSSRPARRHPPDVPSGSGAFPRGCAEMSARDDPSARRRRRKT